MCTALLVAGSLVGGCGGSDAPPSPASSPVGAAPEPVTVSEAFETPRTPADNIDSPAIWHSVDDTPWILATAKEGDAIVVYDAATGEEVQRFGSEGTGPGQLDRPNGIVVQGDYAFVIERNNRRVQVFALPTAAPTGRYDPNPRPIGTFGEDVLRRPYGGTAVQVSGDTLDLYVTDQYETPGEQIPPDSTLHERVKQFRVVAVGDRVSARLVRTFGDTAGAGVLRKVETIKADPAHDRLLIAEEQAKHHAVYTLDGQFTGTIVGAEQFQYEPEGLALYACPDSSGYWIATDQDEQNNVFHVLDRPSFEPLGMFSGPITANTDGVALTQQGFGPFPNGAFYAVHDDQSVTAFDWTAIAEALGLSSTCPARSPEGS